MSQQPPQGPAGTPDEAARTDGGEPTEAFAQSPYDVPPTQSQPLPGGAAPDYDQAPDPTRTIYTDTSRTQPEPEPDAEPGRPRWVVPVVIAAILLLVAGGVLAAYLLGEEDDEPAPVVPTEQATDEPGATDEPTGEPTEQGESTEEPTEEGETAEEPTEAATEEASTQLFDDLAQTVDVEGVVFELDDAGLSPDEDLLADGAVEAWRGQYVSGDTEIDLLATLWPDNDAADAYADELLESIGGDEIESDYTYANETGTYWALILEDGNGSYVWTTDRGHVLQVVGTPDYVGPFYSNFYP